MKSFSLNFFTAIAFTLSVVVFTACGETSTEPQTEITEATYACPMDCEKGKTYAKEGSCPVCEMDLTEVE